MSSDAIKSMRLYSHLERIERALSAAGIDPKGALRVADLSAFDQFHYHGTAAVDAAIEALALGPDDRVAEVGSGVGGPARYIAETAGSRVTALELQPDLNALARELTARCGLAERVEHLCGDVLDGPLARRGYEAVVSWLALYHIADHRSLFTRIYDALKPTGRLFIEDLCTRRPFTDEEWELLSVEIYARRLPTIEEYHGELADRRLPRHRGARHERRLGPLHP